MSWDIKGVIIKVNPLKRPQGCDAGVFDLLAEEEHLAVHIVFGHFVFVYIPLHGRQPPHAPFPDEPHAAGGGYAWTVIPVADRGAYMAALEEASVAENIGPAGGFSRFGQVAVRGRAPAGAQGFGIEQGRVSKALTALLVPEAPRSACAIPPETFSFFKQFCKSDPSQNSSKFALIPHADKDLRTTVDHGAMNGPKVSIDRNKDHRPARNQPTAACHCEKQHGVGRQ